MRSGAEGTGCFPTGRHYPGIAHLLRVVADGVAEEFAADLPVTDLVLACLDTETTGTTAKEDRIVEVGIVLWRAGEITGRHSWLINPERQIPQGAIDVHGISNEDVADKPVFADVCDEILAALEGAVPVAYNADFDRGFVLAELDRLPPATRATPPAVRAKVDWIDPLVWARELQRAEKSKALGEVAARLGIKLAQAHRATADAEATVKVLAKFFGDSRLPTAYGAFMQEQRRLAREQAEQRKHWR